MAPANAGGIMPSGFTAFSSFVEKANSSELANMAIVHGSTAGTIPARADNIAAVKSALWINTLIGGLCLIGFLLFRTFMKQYQLRLYLPQITIRPPPLPTRGIGLVFGWLKPVFTTSDAFVLRSAGLDALVLQKAHTMGLQILLPVAAMGCLILIPIQITQGKVTGDASYARLTMANVWERAPSLWAHWAVAFATLGWVFVLLEYHTRQYAAVRQHYLRGGDDPNYWRDLHMAEADGTHVHKSAKLLDVLGAARFEDMIEEEEELLEATVSQRHWWQRALISITSWTGQESVEHAAQHADIGSKPKSRSASGRMLHVDLAHDVIQGDFIRDAQLAATASGDGLTPAPSGDAPAAGSKDAAVPPTLAETHEPAGAAAQQQPHTHTHTHTHGEEAAVVDESGVMVAPPACCDVEAEETGGLVAHKWWSQVEHVVSKDGKLRRLASNEATNEAVKKVMLAKPSVRYRKTVNAVDRYGRRTAVNAQQYAVLVVNVNQPCYPEHAPRHAKAPANASPLVPGAGTCGNIAANALPPAVKYELQGKLSGHAEELPPGSDPKALRKTRSAPASTHAGRAAAGGGGGAAAAAAAAERKDTDAAAGGDAAAADKDADDVEGGAAPAAAAGPYRGRPGPELWRLVRAAALDGRLSALGRSQAYSLVAAVFSTLFEGDYDRVVPVFNFRRVDLLMRRWDARQRQLEAALFKLAKTGERPLRKTKMFGGEKVDAINWLRADIARLEPAILAEREAALRYGQTPSWFVLFRSQKAAAIASSCNILPMNQDLFQVHPAPGPEEVNWEALWFNHRQRVLRGWLATPGAVFVVLLPVSLLTSAISQLNSEFCKAIDFPLYCSETSPVAQRLRGLVTGFLPSLLVILWQGLALPRLIYLVAQSEGRHYSLSAVDRRMGEIYFYWDVFNMFAQGVLGSAAVSLGSRAAAGKLSESAGADVFRQANSFVNNPSEVPNVLGQALPTSSLFFLSYTIMRTLMTVPLRLLITQPGVWQSWLRLCDVLSRGPPWRPMAVRDAAEAAAVPDRTRFMRTAIRSPRYGVEFGGLLLIMLISLGFAIISPLIVLFGAAFYAGMWLFWRYQLIYNYQRKYEAGGLMWQFFVNRILVCCAIMVAFTGCLMLVKQAFAQASTLWVAGIIFIIAFSHRLNRRYMNAIAEMPLYLAQMAPRARVPPSTYVPPPLQSNGLGWYPEFNKVWEWFGMPGYSW